MDAGNITIIDAESNFKKIDKCLIENEKIDCLTLGIYTKIIVLGKKWNLNIKGLSYHLNISDSKIRKSISLLEQEGYIKRTAVRNEKGQCVGWDYKVFPTPISIEERSKAGVKSETEYPQNRQHGEPTTRLTDNTENGGHIIYRLKENIDLKKNKTEKKKEIYKEIVDYWNEHTKSYSKVRQVTAKIESAINARIRDGYSIDDIKKALLLCESLGEFYKGKEPGKNWKANFYWIISNTNSNFDKILTGDLHISSEQQREFKKVMNGEEYNSNQYHPSTNGSDVRWNEPSQCYICFYPWAFDNLCDGYTKDTRPDNATVYCQGRKYVWSKKQQKWEHD